MSDHTPAPLTPGRHGRTSGRSGLVVRECSIDGAATVIARRGQARALSETAFALLGVRLPATPRWEASAHCTVIWSGPDQWLVEAEHASAILEELYSDDVTSLASVCDQSDSRMTWELSGERVGEVLAKGVPIDLHPTRFRAGDVAWTRVEHIDILLRQMSSAPAYRISVARSFNAALWHWLEASAAEFGCEVMGG